MSNSAKFKESYLFMLPWSLTSLGGVNQVVENLYNQMKLDDKYVPIIMVNSWDDIKIRKQSINGIDHCFFRLRSPWNSSKKIRNFMAFCFEFFRTTWHLCNYIKLNRIIAINVHYCSLYVLNISLLKYIGLFNGHFILSFHGKDLLAVKQSHGIEKIFFKLMLNSADKIITCSESLKEEFADFDGLSLNKIVPIHNGIDTSLFCKDEDRQIESSLEGKKFILNVATLEHKKGQDVLLQAFKKIAQDFADISLVIIGRPGGTESQIKQLIDSLGLSQRVQLYEGIPHDQVLAFMERAMIFALPSRFEPFGIVVLEAGAFGVPVIASNVGGVREILSHDKTGRLCEPDDINCLSKELSNLLTESEERNRLGGNLKNHILKNFSWKQTYEKYLDTIGL